jgi:hypothetical protein
MLVLRESHRRTRKKYPARQVLLLPISLSLSKNQQHHF